jgi:acylphosphatase
MHRVHIVIEGRVQGVGYRAFVLRQARALGVTGAVWNRDDGAVELEAEGERVPLERLIESLREGPSVADVSRLHVDWSEGPAAHHAFTIAASRPR